MQNLKTPMGTVKKGIAQFGVGSAVGMYSGFTAVTAGLPIPLLRDTFYNDSNNISKISNYQFKIKAGIRCRITLTGVFNQPANSDINFRLRNVTDGTYVAGGETYLRTDYGAPNDGWGRDAMLDCIVNPATDTTYEIWNIIAAIQSIYYGTSLTVEELEAYLIPTDPTKYTDVINYASASGSVLIPSGLPVGTKKLIRKLNATQGTVTITCTNETFTSSSLSSITLNADGDFWLVEKVNATRWDLIDGRELVITAEGESTALHTGVLNFAGSTKMYSTAGLTVEYFSWIFPKLFKSAPVVSFTYGTDTSQAYWAYLAIDSLSTTQVTAKIMKHQAVGTPRIYSVATGRWY